MGRGGFGWRSVARCLLHHWAWHVAPTLTTARFLHSPSTAGTVHPPDPASSSQNKLCFVPPHPIGRAWEFICLAKRKKIRHYPPLSACLYRTPHPVYCREANMLIFSYQAKGFSLIKFLKIPVEMLVTDTELSLHSENMCSV